MGIPQLIQATEQITFPGYFGGAVGKAAILCIEDFLNVLAQNPAILHAFKNLLQTLIAFIHLQVAALTLLVDTILLQLDIITPIVEEYKAIKAQLAAELNQFGFDKFVACPPILRVKNALVAQASGVGILGKAFSGIKDMDAYIKRLEFKIIKLKNQINSINALIAELNATTFLFQGIINAIDAQYPGI